MSMTHTREVGDFVRVSHRGIGDVRIEKGDRNQVVVEAAEHILPRLETRVADGTLEIRYRHDWLDWIDWLWRFWSWRPIRFRITMKELTGLSLSGAGNVTASGFSVPAMDIVLKGAGNIRMEGFEAEKLTVRLQGAGNVEISGRAGQQDIELGGAGNFHASRLESCDARVVLGGMGNARIWVRETLAAEIRGLGNIEYYGNPRVSHRSSGLGNLRGLGER